MLGRDQHLERQLTRSWPEGMDGHLPSGAERSASVLPPAPCSACPLRLPEPSPICPLRPPAKAARLQLLQTRDGRGGFRNPVTSAGHAGVRGHHGAGARPSAPRPTGSLHKCCFLRKTGGREVGGRVPGVLDPESICMQTQHSCSQGDKLAARCLHTRAFVLRKGLVRGSASSDRGRMRAGSPSWLFHLLRPFQEQGMELGPQKYRGG